MRRMATRLEIPPVKTAYVLVATTLIAALGHFFVRSLTAHVYLLTASFSIIFICMVLGFQVQPREMRPALLAVFGFWVHLGCWQLYRHYLAPVNF